MALVGLQPRNAWEPRLPVFGGAGAFTPLSLGADLYDMWDAEMPSTISTSGATVTEWRSVKNGYAATQAIGAAMPIYSAVSFNGRPGLLFDGLDDELTYAGTGVFPVGATPSVIWMLVDQMALSADATVRVFGGYGDTASNRRAVARVVNGGVNRGRIDAGNGGGTVTGLNNAVDLSGRHVIKATFTATDMVIDIDGVAGVPTAVVPATASTRFRIGAATAAVAANFASCIFSLLAVTNPLSATPDAQMLAFLKARGGIA